MRAFLSTVAGALLSSMALSSFLAAQTGTFTVYGSGCRGSGGTSCLSANLSQPYAGNTGVRSPFALAFNTGSIARVVCGIELICKTANNNNVNMKVWIYDTTSSGTPGNILGSSTMPVTGTVKANRATFTPLVLKANTQFFIVFDNSVNLNLPLMKSGTRNVHLYLSGTTWRGPFTSFPWNYSVICCGSGSVPKISSTGVPTIGKSFAINLSAARANARTLLALGLTKTNNDLTSFGAPGCALLTNPLAVLGYTTDAAGAFSVSQTVPNDTTLVGVIFDAQFAVVDQVNALQLAFSAGGEGKIGR